MSVIDDIIKEDRVWSALSDTFVMRKTKRGRDGITMNCPLCMSRGMNKHDKKMRLKIYNNANGLGAHCFKCQFKTRWKIGEPLSYNLQSLMLALGVSEYEIKKICYWAFMIARFHVSAEEQGHAISTPTTRPFFSERSLPPGSKKFVDWIDEGCEEKDFLKVIEYVLSRGDTIAEATEYYWSDTEYRDRVIIPCKQNGYIVGHSARSINDNASSRYINEVPPNYLYNIDLLNTDGRQFVIIAEGLLDAIAVEAISPMGAHLNEFQIKWINDSDKDVIYLPDRDFAGSKMIDVAVANNWMVSFPRMTRGGAGRNWWEEDVKDAAEASKRYGKLFTLQSIIANSTRSKLEINLLKRRYY